jgi:hypothetical protein
MDWRCVLAAMVLGTLAWSSRADAPHRYEEGEQVPVAHTFHILVKAEAQALSLLSQIQARPAAARFKTFQKLARKHSIDGGSARDGGDLGKVYPGEMVVSFEHAVFGSHIGVVTGPIHSEFGWHLTYVTELHTEPVAELCERSVNVSMTSADERAREGLAMAQARIDWDAFPDRIKALLGADWEGPYKDGEGQLLFLSILPAAPSENIRIVSRHIEWARARLASSRTPMRCSRSFRDAWAFDCRAQTIGFSSATEFEGRGGRGRTARQFDVPLPQIQFRAVNPGNSEIQLYNHACKGESPLARP